MRSRVCFFLCDCGNKALYKDGTRMEWNFVFFLNSALLGVGLAMDAFSVSLANGLHEPTMKRGKTCLIAGVFAFFQALMPLLGWICIHTLVQYFTAFEKLVPWIALALLCVIGGKMLYEGLKNKSDEDPPSLGVVALLIQGVATSIDALSVGFTIAEYAFPMALVCALIIAALTFGICFAGVLLGKKFGTLFAGKANVFGGVLLILIGIEIFITGIL